MEAVLHLKTTQAFQRKKNNRTGVLVSKFSEACIKLNASIFEPCMGEDEVFEDLSKYHFLANLKTKFESFRRLTNNRFYVTRRTTYCTGCSRRKCVEHFRVYAMDNSGFYEFAFVIDIVDGILIDLYQCHLFNKD